MSNQNININIGLHEIYNHLGSGNRLPSAMYIACLMPEEEIKELIKHCQTLLENPEYGKTLLDSINQEKT